MSISISNITYYDYNGYAYSDGHEFGDWKATATINLSGNDLNSTGTKISISFKSLGDSSRESYGVVYYAYIDNVLKGSYNQGYLSTNYNTITISDIELPSIKSSYALEIKATQTSGYAPAIGWGIWINSGSTVYNHNLVFNANNSSITEEMPTMISYSSSPTTIPNTILTWSGRKFLGWADINDTDNINNTQTTYYTPGSNFIDSNSFNSMLTTNLYTVWDWNGIVKVYTSDGWKDALAYVYDGEDWKQCLPYVYNGSEWKMGVGG